MDGSVLFDNLHNICRVIDAIKIFWQDSYENPKPDY